MDHQKSLIIEALYAIQNPYSSNFQRKEAFDFIEQILFHDIKTQSSNNFKTENRIDGKFSDSSKVSLLYEILLESENLPKENIDSIRFSVLKLLEDWILMSWNKITLEMQIEIRDGIIKLTQLAPFLYKENKSIRTKLAKIISEIAKRQFPIHWDNFLIDMTNIGSQGQYFKSELSFMAVEFIIEDCINSDFNNSLSSQRKNDILTAVKLNMHQLLSYSFMFLSKSLYELLSLVDPHNLFSHLKYQTDMINSALRMLCPLVSISNPDELCYGEFDFSSLIPGLLAVKSLQVNAVSLIKSIISQKLSRDLFYQMMLVLPAPLIGSILLFASDDMTEVFNYKNSIANALCQMLSNNIEHLEQSFSIDDSSIKISFQSNIFEPMLIDHLFSTLRSNPKLSLEFEQHRHLFENYKNSFFTKFDDKINIEATLKIYFEGLVLFLSHPSRRLLQDVIKEFNKIFKCNFINKLNWVPELLFYFLNLFYDRTVKVLWLKEESKYQGTNIICSGGPIYTTLDESASIEFESKEEYLEHFGQLRSHIRTFITIIASKYSQVFLNFTGQKLLTLKNCHSSAANSKFVNEAGGCTYNSAAIVEWDAFFIFLDSGIINVVSSFEQIHINQDSEIKNQSILLSQTVVGKVSLPREGLEIANILLNMTGLAQISVEDPMILLQLLRCIRCLAPVFKYSPSFLVQAFSVLFKQMNFGIYNDQLQYLNQINILRQLAGYSVITADFMNKVNVTSENSPLSIYLEDSLQVRKMTGTIIAHISTYCSDTLIASNLFDQLFSSSLEFLLKTSNVTQRTNMLETLVSLTEKIPDLNKQREIYFQLFDGIVSTLNSGKSHEIFSSPSSLISALENPESCKHLDDCIEAFSSFVSISRRVRFPKLPSEIWTLNAPFSFNQMCAIFPFAYIWDKVLPSLIKAFSSTEALWEPSIRINLHLKNLPPDFTIKGNTFLTSPDMLTSLYDPSIGNNLHTKDKVKSFLPSKLNKRLFSDLEWEIGGQVVQEIDTNNSIGIVFYHLRYQLYQLMGLASGHKVLYIHPSYSAFLSVLMGSLSYMDNAHIVQLTKYFIEPFILNLYPFLYETSSLCVMNILKEITDRLHFVQPANDCQFIDINNILNLNSDLERKKLISSFIYYQCGIVPNSKSTFEEYDVQRMTIISNMSKHYADLFMAMVCIRGFLSPTPEELKSKTDSKSSSKENNPHIDIEISEQNTTSDMDYNKGNDLSYNDSQAQFNHVKVDEIQLEARRKLLLDLILKKRELQHYYFTSIMSLISLSDSSCCKKAIIIIDNLVSISPQYPTIQFILGDCIFKILLKTFFVNEAWMKGLEWDIISTLEQIYTILVPETFCHEFSVNVIIQPPFHPRETLLAIGVDSVIIQKLEKNLYDHKNKKKRRDNFKDFLIEISSQFAVQNFNQI